MQELADAALSDPSKPPRQRRLPKGTSDYQAAWILDNASDDEDPEEEPADAASEHAWGKGGSSHARLETLSEAGDVDMRTEEGGDDDDDDGLDGSEVSVDRALQHCPNPTPLL